MAVLENIPGLSVTIVSCGKELTEYENADDIPSGEAAHKTVLKYVECASDELFCIKIYVKKPFKLRKGFDALLIKTYVDGKHSISEILMAKRLDKDGCFSMTVEGQLLYQLNGDALLKKFTFAPIKAGMSSNIPPIFAGVDKLAQWRTLTMHELRKTRR
jgi:hypothetical protein